MEFALLNWPVAMDISATTMMSKNRSICHVNVTFVFWSAAMVSNNSPLVYSSLLEGYVWWVQSKTFFGDGKFHHARTTISRNPFRIFVKPSLASALNRMSDDSLNIQPNLLNHVE